MDRSTAQWRRLVGGVAQISIRRSRRPSALPGFGLAFGYTLFYLGLVVLLPLAALVMQAAGLGLGGIWAVATEPRVTAALRISFGLALAAALLDCLFGLLIAWVLTRYEFPGRRLIDAAVDLPFALPTAVAGIALATPYAPNDWMRSVYTKKISSVVVAVSVIVIISIAVWLKMLA